VSLDYFKNFSLCHSEIEGTREDFSRSNSRIIRVNIPQIRVTVVRILALVADMEIATIPECWTIRAMIQDGIGFLLLFENSRTQIVGILDRENKTPQTRICNVTASRTPRNRSVSSKNTIVLAQNQCDSI
jgi:hypothetical protein